MPPPPQPTPVKPKAAAPAEKKAAKADPLKAGLGRCGDAWEGLRDEGCCHIMKRRNKEDIMFPCFLREAQGNL